MIILWFFIIFLVRLQRILINSLRFRQLKDINKS